MDLATIMAGYRIAQAGVQLGIGAVQTFSMLKAGITVEQMEQSAALFQSEARDHLNTSDLTAAEAAAVAAHNAAQ